jgi:hypothetical protein
MAAIAAADAGYASEKNCWLDHLRAFLLDRDSEQITCIQVGSAAGVSTLTARLDPADAAVKRRTVCTIQHVSQASGDYCLELANLARRDASTPIAATSPSPPEERKSRTQRAILVRPDADAQFPGRAAWLRERLAERSWNRHDPARQRGPDCKTIDRILSGKAVREDVLEKLAKSLSAKIKTVSVLDIPRD